MLTSFVASAAAAAAAAVAAQRRTAATYYKHCSGHRNFLRDISMTTLEANASVIVSDEQ